MKGLTPVLFALAFIGLAGRAFAADDATVQKGEKVFDYWCATCHGPAIARHSCLRDQVQGRETGVAERTDGLNSAGDEIVRAPRRLDYAVLPQDRNQRRGSGRAGRVSGAQ